MESPEKPWSMLSKRSLGDQLDAWCEMLAAASAAVGTGPGARHGVGPAGVVSPVSGLHVPRPPEVPRPAPRTRDTTTAYVLAPGQLTELTLPHAAKPPVGPNNRATRVVVRKRSTKKASSGGVAGSREDTRKKHKTKGKGRTRSRTSLASTELSSKSDSWTNVSSIGQNPVSLPSAPSEHHNGGGATRNVLSQPHKLISPSLMSSSIVTTTQVSESESDVSESDKSEAECVEDEAPSTSHPRLAKHILNRSTETTTCNFNCVSSSKFNNDGAELAEVTMRFPQYRSTHNERNLRLSHGALSQSMSNLTKLPEVAHSHTQEGLGDTAQHSRSTTSRHTRGKHHSGGHNSSRVFSIDTHESKPVEKKKRPPKPSIISLVKPLNQESEKAKFLASRNYEYNPQFQYKNPVDPSAYKKYFKPEYKLMPLALKVIRNVITNHGSYDKFAKKSGGRELTRDQILELVNSYLKEEGLEDEVLIKLSSDLVSRACMTRVKGRPLLQVQTNNVHEGWMEGLLRHEIGTHYLRSCNNRCQQWRKARKRHELEMDHQNPTEEGLASLHSVIFREDPCLWRAAMLYYTVARASDLSFSALFNDLGKFAKDPNVRWDYCLRAKRGLVNTADPGAFTKDQVYLKGGLEILKNRKKIDFHALVRLGKVSYRDIDRLMGSANFQNTRIPRFMRDLDYYHMKLDQILSKNGLDDEDLEDV